MLWIWLLLCGALVVAELLLVDMTALMLALGALAAVVPAALGLGWFWQGLVFSLVSLACVVFLRPPIRRLLEPRESAHSTDGFVGREGEVLEAISPDRRGRVKLYGEIWNAVAYEPIAAGERVIVTAIRDNCLEVLPRAELGHQALESLAARPLSDLNQRLPQSWPGRSGKPDTTDKTGKSEGDKA